MLELLAKDHKTWVDMVIKMGCQTHIAEDIVQDMYIRIDRLVKDKKRIMYSSKEVNRFFIYVTLRNLYFTHLRLSKRIQIKDYKEFDFDTFIRKSNSIDEGVDWNMEIAFDKVYNEIQKEINSWGGYNSKLCDLYFKTDVSLRNLSKGTDISLTSLYNSIKNYKNILKVEFGESVDNLMKKKYNKC